MRDSSVALGSSPSSDESSNVENSARRRLGIEVGDKVALRVENDELGITTLRDNIERPQRLGRSERGGSQGESLAEVRA